MLDIQCFRWSSSTQTAVRAAEAWLLGRCPPVAPEVFILCRTVPEFIHLFRIFL